MDTVIVVVVVFDVGIINHRSLVFFAVPFDILNNWSMNIWVGLKMHNTWLYVSFLFSVSLLG